MKVRDTGFRSVVRDAAIAVVVFSALGIAVNGIRSDGIPLVAPREYELFVPCPEPLGEVEVLEPDDTRIGTGRVLWIDARDAAAFDRWHLPGAIHVPFDWLEGVPDALIRRIAASGAVRVVVYGDGGDPDSGRELARELAGRGVRNVFFVRGGAPALRSREVTAGERAGEDGP